MIYQADAAMHLLNTKNQAPAVQRVESSTHWVTQLILIEKDHLGVWSPEKDCC